MVYSNSLNQNNLSEAARLLGHAADNGELAVVEKLLAQYPDILEARGGIMGSTPLHFASASGHVSIVRMLLDAGANPDAREHASNTTPMHWASAHGHLEIVETLAESGASVHLDDGWYYLAPIAWACALPANAKRPVAECLIDHGASYDIFSLISLRQARDMEQLIFHSNSALEARIGRIGDNLFPLQWAVEKAHLDIVSVLVTEGADVNQKSDWGLSAHALAVQAGKSDLSNYLLQCGANIDLSYLIASKNYQEARQLLECRAEVVANGGECQRLSHALVHTGDAEGLGIVLSGDSNPDIESPMIVDSLICAVTPLHRASIHGRSDLVRLLLEYGADPNHMSKQVGDMPHWSVTPLHGAAWKGHSDVAKTLIEFGADPTLRDNRSGETPSDWARSWWDDEIAKYFDMR